MSNETRGKPFWSKRSGEDLAAEQGVGAIQDPSKLFGAAADLWESDEEFDAYVEGIYQRRAESRRRAAGETQTGAA